MADVYIVPDADTLERIGDVPGADIRVWDLSVDPEEAGIDPAAVRGVLVPNYFFSPDGWRRLQQLPAVRLVQLPSAGFEHALRFIPPQAALANGAGVHDAETAEHAVGLALASVRGLDRAFDAQRSGRWAPELSRSFVDRRVTVVGFGHIGEAIVSRLLPFEVEVEVVARHERDAVVDGRSIHVRPIDELDAVLPATDVLILILPLNDASRGLIDARRLALLPDGAHVVNVARGGIVVTDDLTAEVRRGRLYTALDGTDPEPLPAGHPLWHLAGAIITPHIGGLTDATPPRVSRLWKRQIAALVRGETPINLVETGTAGHES